MLLRIYKTLKKVAQIIDNKVLQRFYTIFALKITSRLVYRAKSRCGGDNN